MCPLQCGCSGVSAESSILINDVWICTPWTFSVLPVFALEISSCWGSCLPVSFSSLVGVTACWRVADLQTPSRLIPSASSEVANILICPFALRINRQSLLPSVSEWTTYKETLITGRAGSATKGVDLWDQSTGASRGRREQSQRSLLEVALALDAAFILSHVCLHAFYYFSPNRCKPSYHSRASLHLDTSPYQPACSREEASKTVEELKCVLPGAFILSGWTIPSKGTNLSWDQGLMCRLAVLALMCCLTVAHETKSLQLQTKPLCTIEGASLLPSLKM